MKALVQDKYFSSIVCHGADGKFYTQYDADWRIVVPDGTVRVSTREAAQPDRGPEVDGEAHVLGVVCSAGPAGR